MIRTSELLPLNGLNGDDCGWNNPCSDLDRVVYRLEWYAFEFFEQKYLPLAVFMKIVYQSWLQIVMIKHGQDKSGWIYRQHAVYGSAYFVAFGGSADHASKPGNNFYADRREKAHCNTKEMIPNSHNLFWGKGYYELAQKYFYKGEISLKEFLEGELYIEHALFMMEQQCKGRGDDLTEFVTKAIGMWIATIPTIVNEINALQQTPDVIEWGPEIERALAEERKGNQQKALSIAGIGAAAIAALGIVFFTSDKK